MKQRGKIAAVTMTYNDGYKIKEWRQWYDEVKDEIDLYIVVDNCSSPDYLQLVKDNFSDSVLIERKTNGGCTAAYNDGIRYALQDKDVDAILIFGNDVRFAKGAISELHTYLYSDEKLGMVGPAMLRKDSEIIEDYGVNMGLFNTQFLYSGREYSNNFPDMIVDVVPGGASMSKRSFYEKVGLQDEVLFMYCDERDMSYRAKRAGFAEGVTAKAKAWHQHIVNPQPATRVNARYMIGRNYVYCIKKHMSLFLLIKYVTCSLLINCGGVVRNLFNKQRRNSYLQYLRGLKAGLLNDMDNNKIWEK